MIEILVLCCTAATVYSVFLAEKYHSRYGQELERHRASMSNGLKATRMYHDAFRLLPEGDRDTLARRYGKT